MSVRNPQFGYDCELTDDERSLFCGEFFRDPSIKQDKVGVRTVLRKLFLCLCSWYDVDRIIDDCPWCARMSGSVVDSKDLLLHGWDGGGGFYSFGSGVIEDRIARRLTSLAIAARN